VIFPLTTRGYQVVVISTPRGKNTKFYELVSNPDTYSVHFVDIHRAVAEGLVLRDNNGKPTTIEVFRKLYGDEIGWQREYLCLFTGDLEALVAWAKLTAAAQRGEGLPFDCLRIEGEAGWKADFFKIAAIKNERGFIGWDVARTSDLSSLWVNIGLPGGTCSLRCLVLMHKTPFALQREVARAAMNAIPGAVGCGDATGLGMDSNETLHTEYGDRWQPVTFTATSKRELASELLTGFDDNDQAIPAIDGPHKFVATDIYGVQADRSGGTLKLVETPNPLLPESHCDVAWSAGLARHAMRIAPAEGHLWVA
jgi:phage FluMu gp28-like protein